LNNQIRICQKLKTLRKTGLNARALNVRVLMHAQKAKTKHFTAQAALAKANVHIR